MQSMPLSLRVRLSAVMFLEYFTWGAWYVTMGTYLFSQFQAGAVQVGSAYANLAIAAIISPFFIGLIADRYFAAQKVFGVLHLSGAVTLYMMGEVTDFSVFWWLLLLYTLLYMPTMALTNSITFRQLKDGGREFPLIRVFGTAGWIVAGLLIGFAGLESSPFMFYIAAFSSLLLAVLSFFLPDSPPDKTRSAGSLSSVLGLDALVLFKNRSFVIFFLSSLAICIPLSFYYSFTNPFLNDVGVDNAAGKMTLGQFSEFAFMLLIPLLFRRYGVKTLLIIGIAAWICRYVLFAYGDADVGMWMLYGGIILHGVCYDFFFVTGQIYTDQQAGDRFKNAAQGLITFATYGVGMLIGSYVSGGITAAYALPADGGQGYDWQGVWLVPAGISLAILVVFALVFKEKKKAAEMI